MCQLPGCRDDYVCGFLHDSLPSFESKWLRSLPFRMVLSLSTPISLCKTQAPHNTSQCDNGCLTVIQALTKDRLMHRLPLDILTQILIEACFDDKFTGCSLSLVSKSISEVVNLIRFEAVSLYDVHQVFGFAEMLQKLRLPSPKIKHLFISAIGTNGANQLWVSRQKKMRKQARKCGLVVAETKDYEDDEEPKLDRNMDRQWRMQEALDGAFHNILIRAASSIKTLFITTIPIAGSTTSFRCALPNLTHLSITGVNCKLSAKQPFSALRLIHVDQNPIDFDFRSSTPTLEELRFTSVREGAWKLVNAILDHSGCLRIDARQSAFPASLRRVVLQQWPLPHEPQ